MADTKEAIRAAGGIVHGDGNVFFTNTEQFLAAARASLPAAAAEPVAWQYRESGKGGCWWECSEELARARAQHADKWDVRPLYATPQPAPAAEWVSVAERLPEWAARDDTPCFINGKEVPPTLFSATVIVALRDGGVRTDKLTTIEGKSDGWWHTFGERVVAWQPTPAPPSSAGKRGGE